MRSHLFSRRLWTKDFVLILLVCTIASYPNSILISLLPVYVLDLGGTNTWTGMMMTGLTLLGMVTNAAVAPLIDRVGRKKLLVLGNGLYALNAAMFCLTEDLTALFVLRVLCGFTQGVFFPVPPIVAADNAPEDLMVDAMGLFGAASSIAFAVTPTIGLFLYETFGPQAMFLSGAAMGTVSFVLSLFVTERYHRPQEARGERERSSFRFDWAFVTMILLPSLVNFFVLFGNSAVQSFLTPCGLSRGIQQISLFFLVNQGVVILARLLVGRVLERFSKRVCVLCGLWMTAGGTLLIAVAAHLPAMLVAGGPAGAGPDGSHPDPPGGGAAHQPGGPPGGGGHHLHAPGEHRGRGHRPLGSGLLRGGVWGNLRLGRRRHPAGVDLPRGVLGEAQKRESSL